MKRKTRDKIIKGSGNVFKDMGFEDPWEHQLKADLAIEIIQNIDKRKLTHVKAAKLIGATQPDISNLKNGQLRDFTMDRLFYFLRKLDIEVSVKLKPRKMGDTKKSSSDHPIHI